MIANRSTQLRYRLAEFVWLFLWVVTDQIMRSPRLSSSPFISGTAPLKAKPRAPCQRTS